MSERSSSMVYDYPSTATEVPGLIFHLLGTQFGVNGKLKRVEVGNTSDDGYSLVWPLRGLRPDGRHAALELIHKRLGNTQRAIVGLYYNCEENGQVLGNVRLIQADRDLALRSGEQRLKQQVTIDPLQPGVRLLGYPEPLLRFSHMMEFMAIEMATGLPEYFDLVATVEAA